MIFILSQKIQAVVIKKKRFPPKRVFAVYKTDHSNYVLEFLFLSTGMKMDSFYIFKAECFLTSCKHVRVM